MDKIKFVKTTFDNASNDENKTRLKNAFIHKHDDETEDNYGKDGLKIDSCDISDVYNSKIKKKFANRPNSCDLGCIQAGELTLKDLCGMSISDIFDLILFPHSFTSAASFSNWYYDIQDFFRWGYTFRFDGSSIYDAQLIESYALCEDDDNPYTYNGDTEYFDSSQDLFKQYTNEERVLLEFDENRNCITHYPIGKNDPVTHRIYDIKLEYFVVDDATEFDGDDGDGNPIIDTVVIKDISELPSEESGLNIYIRVLVNDKNIDEYSEYPWYGPFVI